MENIKPANQPLEFIEFLNRFLPWIQLQIPTPINSGGCGIFAQMLLRKFRQLGLTTKIFIIISKEVTLKPKKLLQDTIKGVKEVNSLPVDHVILSPFKDLYLDSNGWNPGMMQASLEDYFLEIDEDMLDKIVDEVAWNPIFDKEQVPLIQKLVDKIAEKFADYLNGDQIKFPTESPKLSKNTQIAMQREHENAFQHMFSPLFR